MYYETRVSFLFLILVSLLISFIPRPQAWFEGFMIQIRDF